MRPEQVKRLQGSFDRVWVTGRVVTLFYDRLFLIAPHTRSLFPADMESPKMKFTNMLASAIGLIERQPMFTSIIEDLGRRHARYGVAEADYDAGFCPRDHQGTPKRRFAARGDSVFKMRDVLRHKWMLARHGS
jgi:hypothetical protein